MILLVGVIAGTYSTVTIVPAVAIAWNHLTGRKTRYRRPGPHPDGHHPRDPGPAKAQDRVARVRNAG